MDNDKLRQYIRQVIKEVKDEDDDLEEMTGTGAVAGFDTPNAFSNGSDSDKKRKKKTATQLGYTIVTENRWLDLKREDATPKAKLGVGIRRIKNQLSEIETFLNWYGRLKTENGVNSDDYWKQTTRNLHKIRERLMNISDKIRKL
jgi:hypothetical protein